MIPLITTDNTKKATDLLRSVFYCKELGSAFQNSPASIYVRAKKIKQTDL